MRSLSPRTVLPLAAALVALASPLVALPADAQAALSLGAPKDFEAAVRSLEVATGGKATKLRDLPLDQARSFAVEHSLAGRLLDANHATFKRAGVYLFRHERSYGMAGEKDQLGLVKTTDWRRVVLAVGTAGPNRQPSTEKIAAWLDALGKDERFDLDEIGTDYIAGQFDRTPKDPAAVARRCAEFAPELVAGRASTLELLAHEIATNRSLYLIW
jgi:hypothetical protein